MVKNIQGNNLKKVLIIAYSFPPAGGGRVRRVIKFVKFLPEFGWEPIVLTVKKPVVQEYDCGLLNTLSKYVKIVRTSSLETRLIKQNIKINTRNNKKVIFIQKFREFIFGILKKFKWYVFFPDSRAGWIPFCVWKGWQIIKKEKIDLIFVTGEPFSSFVSGVILKKLTKRPLVLDFRDEWAEFSDYYSPEKPIIIKKLERVLEQAVVRNADKVVSVTQTIIENFIKRYKRENKSKFLCITNGFDPDDFKALAVEPKRDNKFTITHTGSLYKLRTPEHFLMAIRKLIENKPDFLKNIRIIFVGTNDNTVTDLLNSNSRLKEIIEVAGYLRYEEALKTMMQSDLLLYIEDQVQISNRLLPAKLFEYMATKKPVIALANNGPVKEIIEYTECGKVIRPDDIEGLVDCLDYFYQNFKENKPLWQQSNMNRVMEFSRKNTSQKLAKTLDKLISRSCKGA